MNSRFVSIWVCVVGAIGLDVAIKGSELGFLSYLAVIAGAIISTFGHFVAALPATFKNQTVKFEKKLFIFSCNLMALLAAFKMLLPEYSAWYYSTEELDLTARLTAAGLMVLLSVCVIALVDKAINAVELIVVGAQPDLNLVVSVLSAAFGGLMLMNWNTGDSQLWNTLIPFIALGWIALCVHTGLVAQSDKASFGKVIGATMLIFGANLLFAHPLRSLLIEHRGTFEQMDFEQALDILVGVICWGVFTTVASTCIGMRHILWESAPEAR